VVRRRRGDVEREEGREEGRGRRGRSRRERGGGEREGSLGAHSLTLRELMPQLINRSASRWSWASALASGTALRCKTVGRGEIRRGMATSLHVAIPMVIDQVCT
jgi:hypothetical protein